MAQAPQVDGDSYTIRWDEDLEAVVHKWTEFAGGETFRQGCWDMLDLIEETNATKVLVDHRAMNAIQDEDIGWMMEVWEPEASETDLEFSVVVLQESVIAEMNVERVMEGMDAQETEHAMTKDIDEARELVRNY